MKQRQLGKSGPWVSAVAALDLELSGAELPALLAMAASVYGARYTDMAWVNR